MAKSRDKDPKTNVMRILEQHRISYQAHYYEHPSDEHGALPVDGATVASLLGQDPRRVFKTLVTLGASGEPCVFMIPVEQELDLKAAARSAGEKSVEMLPVARINSITGYVRGGCSPIGMKKQFRTYLDESALGFPTILFSGGKIGTQVEMAPADLLTLIGAQAAPLAVPAGR